MNYISTLLSKGHISRAKIRPSGVETPLHGPQGIPMKPVLASILHDDLYASNGEDERWETNTVGRFALLMVDYY